MHFVRGSSLALAVRRRNMDASAKASLLQRFVVLLKIGYTELQYWLVGMTPEGYHLAQSRNYDELGAVERSAHHAREVLKYAEYPEPRARLGYYYATRGSVAEAAEHYRKTIETWPHPSILLALAQVELRLQRYDVAAELLERAENSEMKEQLVEAIAEIRSELSVANNVLQGDVPKRRAPEHGRSA
jgi:tetratricopeptide (TPR) repeat protein